MTSFRFDRRFLFNAGLSATSTFAMQGATLFVLLPFLERYLGTESFGYFMLAYSFIVFLIPTVSGAQNLALMRHQRDVPERDRGGFWLTGGVLILAAGMITGAAMLAASGTVAERWGVPVLGRWLPALAPYMVATMVYYTLRCQLIAALAYTRLVIFDLLFGAAILLVPLACRAGWLGDRWPLLMAGAPILASAATLAYLVSTGRYGLRGAGPSIARRILRPAAVYLVGAVGVYGLRYADRWLLGEAEIGGTEIAYYAVAVQAAYLVLFPFEHVSAVLVSYFSNAASLEEIELSQLRRYFYGLGLSMVGLVVISMPIGWVYLRYFYGPEYLPVGMKVFGITIAGLTVYLLQMFGRGIVVRFRHPAFDPVIQWICGVVGLSMAWWLLQSHGVIGAAIGRNVGFIGVGVLYFIACEAPLFARAFLRRR